MPLHKKYFIHYYRVSISEGLNTELSTSDLMLERFDKYFRDVVFAIVQLKLRKLLLKKKTFAIIACHFWKTKTKITQKFTSFGQKIKNIEFLQTFIVHLWIVYLDMRKLQIKLVKLVKK